MSQYSGALNDSASIINEVDNFITNNRPSKRMSGSYSSFPQSILKKRVSFQSGDTFPSPIPSTIPSPFIGKNDTLHVEDLVSPKTLSFQESKGGETFDSKAERIKHRIQDLLLKAKQV